MLSMVLIFMEKSPGMVGEEKKAVDKNGKNGRSDTGFAFSVSNSWKKIGLGLSYKTE